jgi:cardiolipin synthase
MSSGLAAGIGLDFADMPIAALLFIFFHVAVCLATTLRILSRRNPPGVAMAWVLLILLVPAAGAVLYVMIGERRLGRRWIERAEAERADLALRFGALSADSTRDPVDAGPVGEPVARLTRALASIPIMGGHKVELISDTGRILQGLIDDIDACRERCSLEFYIWHQGGLVDDLVEALIRAAGRGVAVTALMDGLGSRPFIRQGLAARMRAAGIVVVVVLPVNALRMVFARVDLRNHRKIAVIDNRITYCGSQNCADPEFLVKAKYAPWVDAVIRFTGPVVRQNQHLFATDWMTESGEDIGHLLTEPLAVPEPGFAAQVIASGPTAYPAAAPEMFASLMFNARRELIVTTPYYVPVDSLQAALRAAANRGVDTTIIFPARNDDFAVKAASQSYYEDLLRAGVKIFEYHPGLLHAKTVTVDGEITLIGSANMDRRSFDLNYENNILLCDAAMTAAVRDRQMSYLADSRPVMQETVLNWSWRTRLWNNALAVVGPVL